MANQTSNIVKSLFAIAIAGCIATVFFYGCYVFMGESETHKNIIKMNPLITIYSQFMAFLLPYIFFGGIFTIFNEELPGQHQIVKAILAAPFIILAAVILHLLYEVYSKLLFGSYHSDLWAYLSDMFSYGGGLLIMALIAQAVIFCVALGLLLKLLKAI